MPLSLPRRKFLTYLGFGTIGWQLASCASRPTSASQIVTPESKIITPDLIAKASG
jgi:hypothetical protein